MLLGTCWDLAIRDIQRAADGREVQENNALIFSKLERFRNNMIINSAMYFTQMKSNFILHSEQVLSQVKSATN